MDQADLAERRRKLRHIELNNKLKVGKEYKRAGVPVQVQTNWEVPIVQIAASTHKNKNQKAEQLKWAMNSKNKAHQRRE